MPSNRHQQSDQILFQFAGEKAAFANRYLLKTAQGRIEAGDNPESVRQETGWFQGIDRKWRFEISDHEAELSELGTSIASEPNGAQPVRRKLWEVLIHERLFAAYPQLKSIPVQFSVSDNRQSVKGQAVVNDNAEIEIILELPSNPSTPQILSVLLHEIQHGIQTYEGFARGGRAEEFEYRLNTLRKELNEIDAASTAQNRVKYLGEAPEIAYAFISDTKDIPVERVRYFAEAYNNEELLSKFNDGLEQKRKLDPYRAYRRLAGEVEARNVQSRALLTPEERRLTPPGETEDMDSGEVLVRFNGRAMHGIGLPVNLMKDSPSENRAAIHLKGVEFAKILLSENSDASSLIHEGAHLYLEVFDDLAKQPNSDSSLKDDFRTILNWFGLKEHQWDSMTLDQKRHYHEQFAESFELYMAEGRSPSVALEREFLQFEGWMGGVYTSLQDALPNARLNDDIRALFDRMLSHTDTGRNPVADLVYEQVHQQLSDIGIDQAEALGQAAIFGSAFASFHARSGMSAADFLNRYGFSFAKTTQPIIESSDIILKRAKDQGYAGASIVDAASWVGAGKKGLDLSLEARRKRAVEQGFDVSKVYYHGTGVDFDAFSFNPENRPGNVGSGHPSGRLGFWFSPDPAVANSFAEWSGIGSNTATVYPVFLKSDNQKIYEYDAEYQLAVQHLDDLESRYSDELIDQVYEKQEPILNDMQKGAGIFSDMAFRDAQTLYLKTLNDIEDRVTGGLSADIRTARKAVKALKDLDECKDRDPFHQFMDDLGYTPGYGYKVDWEGARKKLIEEGFTSVLIRGTTVDAEGTGRKYVDQVVVLDPSIIRSVNAAFDPEELSTARLLAQRGMTVSTANEVIEAANDGLSMDESSRISRAREQGFNTSTIWYHGSFSSFQEFNPRRSGSSGFHFSKDKEFAQYYAESKSMAAELDADVVVRGFYLRGELFDFNNSDHLSKLASVLPEKIAIQGRYGFAAWFGDVQYHKEELLEAIQGIQTPYTGLDEKAKEAIRTGKNSFMREGSPHVVIGYDAVRDEVQYMQKWEADKIQNLEASIKHLKRSYGAEYYEIPLLERQLERERANQVPRRLELEPAKAQGHDNWEILEAPEMKPYLEMAGFSGATMQEKRNINAVIFDPSNIRETSAAFNPSASLSANLYAQSDLNGTPRFRKSAITTNGINAEDLKAAVLPVASDVRIPVNVVNRIEELPARLKSTMVKDDALEDTSGLFDQLTGQTFLIARNIASPKEAVLTYLHETGHAAFRAASGMRYAEILDNIYRDLPKGVVEKIYNANKSQLHNLPADERRRVIADEWVANIAETNPRNTWIQTIVSSIRSWLRELKPDIAFTKEDVIDLLRKGRKQLRSDIEAVFIHQDVTGNNHSENSALENISARSDAFKYGNNIDGQTIEKALKDVFKGKIDVDVMRTNSYHSDPEAKAEFSVYLAQGIHNADVTIFRKDENKCFEQIFSSKGSGLGAPLYQALFAWAHDNNKVLTMDPEGITDINLLRRTEAAISSALRFDTTKHIEMYPESYVGLLPDKDYEEIMQYRKRAMDMRFDQDLIERPQEELDNLVPPPVESYKKLSALFQAMWCSGKNSDAEDVHRRNLEGMIEAARALVIRRVPEIEHYTVDSDGNFLDNRIGKVVDKSQLPIAPEQGVGVSTAMRAIISGMNIVSELSGENNGIQNSEYGAGLLYRKSQGDLSAESERWRSESYEAAENESPAAVRRFGM